MLPPNALVGHAMTADVDWDRCSPQMKSLKDVDLTEGWDAIEQLAVDAGG